MQAITVRDRDAGLAGLSLTEVPYPHAAENDVIVRVSRTPPDLLLPRRAGPSTRLSMRDLLPSCCEFAAGAWAIARAWQRTA